MEAKEGMTMTNKGWVVVTPRPGPRWKIRSCQCETCGAEATQKVFDDILACDECAGWHRDAGR